MLLEPDASGTNQSDLLLKVISAVVKDIGIECYI